ncbi:hypothetical protein [Streptomyces sp. NPDC001743]|uniref:hypothetical protein n=1 Tax=Streptomyces sp. NPDC001743 TaxID=3154397 RepID=UPI003326D3A4
MAEASLPALVTAGAAELLRFSPSWGQTAGIAADGLKHELLSGWPDNGVVLLLWRTLLNTAQPLLAYRELWKPPATP